MEPQPPSLPPHKGTPARRRPKRPVNSPARKTYASENDMPSEALFPIELAGPFTPQKSASNSPAPLSQPHAGKSKARNGNKGRAKQVSSPGPAKQGRTTPPQTTSVKPITAAAFAGATFHASPAPDSLPIPSFLSRALDSPSVQETDHASREPSPPVTDSEAAPTPQHRLLPTNTSRHESPLDIFFRADRAEKERARRASSANILGSQPIPFSPPSQIRSPTEPKTLPGAMFGANNRRPFPQRNPSSGIPTSELDGVPSTVIGPALSKPFQERIREARSNKKPPEPAHNPLPSPQDQAAMDMSERLKRFLAIPSNPSEGPSALENSAPQTAPWPTPSNHPSHPFLSGAQPPRSADFLPPFSAGNQPSKFSEMLSPFAPENIPNISPPASSKGTPPATNSPTNGRSADLLHMEDSLRRMLKMNPGPAPETPPRPNYRSS
ncbi:hypothetical protein CHGG_05824 [Chaetomium globosum CBS 148.51]|uniref:Proteophosphoglycan 5 n=1 Tax=Chaetomium globosum (strain ATCC 6205 / CBS 148.51 / DSM 1962 / NBRC 6347 / NRRL 1970) TaxID=306901 RepID=Q2H691_CHAGB|nr:uncharacterized protein CHGG_05824 [Chaetomium globosum CBS 148.51]EAQ89205.1 hypothetical protein CHGG_05824 [Chaetomium globosum CBS 148.51]